MMTQSTTAMRALRFHGYGDPAVVLRLDEILVPSPGRDRVRVRVHACALNPADWALCQGFLPHDLPRGIGLDVSGIVDAVGEGVEDVRVGDRVFGVPDFLGCTSAGASDHAIMAVWVRVPEDLDLAKAAALPMAVETAVRALDLLGAASGQTLFVNGGGTMTGFAAVQMALMRGAKVVASAGGTFADRLLELGAQVTSYGDGLVERVRNLAGGSPDHVLHTAQVDGALPDLVRIAGGDPRRVMSISDFDADGIGVRTTGREPDLVPRYDALGHFAQLAAEGRFTVPVARSFGLEDWRSALDLSQGRRAHGKLLLLPDPHRSGS